jgi:hypothetical protein
MLTYTYHWVKKDNSSLTFEESSREAVAEAVRIYEAAGDTPLCVVEGPGQGEGG